MSEHAQEGNEVRMSGVVEHHHRWVGNGEPASAGGTPRSAAPAYPAGGWHGNYILFPWDWMWGVLVFGVVLAALAAAAYGIFSWVDSNDSGARARGVTMAQVLRRDGFRPSRHAVCGITSVSGGTAYRLTLNRGRACKRTVEVVLPAEKVQWAISRRARQTNATWVLNPRVLGSSELSAIRRLALGEKLKVGVRHVIVRLTPKDYRRLQS